MKSGAPLEIVLAAQFESGAPLEMLLAARLRWSAVGNAVGGAVGGAVMECSI